MYIVVAAQVPAMVLQFHCVRKVNASNRGALSLRMLTGRCLHFHCNYNEIATTWSANSLKLQCNCKRACCISIENKQYQIRKQTVHMGAPVHHRTASAPVTRGIPRGVLQGDPPGGSLGGSAWGIPQRDPPRESPGDNPGDP